MVLTLKLAFEIVVTFARHIIQRESAVRGGPAIYSLVFNFWQKKFIYVVYNMCMYHKISNNTTKQTFQLHFAS